MNQQFRPIALTAATLMAVAAAPARAADLPLTVAQVEKVSGLSGLSTKPAKYDKAGTNFVTAKGDTVITLKVASASVFDTWKSQPSMNDQVALSGVGDDAVVSKKGHYVCFKKAGQGACVVAGIALPGSPALVNDAQLAELARLAAGK